MSSTLSQEQKVIHFLNRTSFGPTPAMVRRVSQLGMRAYLEEQLAPETIADSDVEEKVAGLKTIRMNSRELFELYPPPQVARERGMAMAGAMNAPRFVIFELQQARLLRAVYSQRQLYEVMVDFWINHFNIFAAKGANRWLMTSYDRDTIRPLALGKFRDLLLATARSPAMLFYLDNWLSVSPNSFAARQPGNLRRRGLNENYAREIMELHTLGVDGGYSQQDVHEIARCFTGWTLRRPRGEAEFLCCTIKKLKLSWACTSRPTAAWRTAFRSSTIWRVTQLPQDSSRPNWRAASSPMIRPHPWSSKAQRRFDRATAIFERCSVRSLMLPSSFRPQPTAPNSKNRWNSSRARCV
jgi:hypothetical protein